MMKRLLAILLAVLMVLSLAGCGGNRADEVEGLGSYDDLIQIADENRAPYVASNVEETMNIDQYAISDKELLTQEEIEALRAERPKADKVSVEQALEDVDLFFRAWKYSYPSYYHMGEELFLNGREKAVAAVSEHDGDIVVERLGNILFESMSFLQDDHSSVNGIIPAHGVPELYYLSYTDTKQPFDKDEKGYYQTYEGVKWYFSSCSNAAMRLEPALLETGEVAYCPLLVVPKAEAVEKDSMILKNGEEEKNVKLRWIASKDMERFEEGKQYVASVENDVYYIDYLNMWTAVGDVNEFIQMAEEAKQYKAVIFDLRHVLGYEHWQIVDWITMFTGKTPRVATAFLTRNNALRNSQSFGDFRMTAIGEEYCDTWYVDGRSTSNTIPLIILMDKSCGSSVEEAINYLRTLDNAIVIGGNTAGCAQGGSPQTHYLPHSGVQFAIGGFMEYQGEARNIDGIGYEPDIWCNPADAKTLALKFIDYYGLKDIQFEGTGEDGSDDTEKINGVLSDAEISALVTEGNFEEICSKITVDRDCMRLITDSGIKEGPGEKVETAFADKVLRADKLIELACRVLEGDYEEVGMVTTLPDNFFYFYLKDGEEYYLYDIIMATYTGVVYPISVSTTDELIAEAVADRDDTSGTIKAWPW